MSPFLPLSRTFLRFGSVFTWQKKLPHIIVLLPFLRLVGFPTSWSVPDVEVFFFLLFFLSTGHKTFWVKWAHSSMKSQRATQRQTISLFCTWNWLANKPKTRCGFRAASALKDLRQCNGTSWFWMELLSMAALVCYWDIFLTESWVETSLHMFSIDCWVVDFWGVSQRGWVSDTSPPLCWFISPLPRSRVSSRLAYLGDEKESLCEWRWGRTN